MDLVTISSLSKMCGVSTRTLRYYEELGLIRSRKQDDYAYRTYDQGEVKRLQQILLLRKLNIRLKEIPALLENQDVEQALTLFKEHLTETNQTITALTTLQTIYEELIHKLSLYVDQNLAAALSNESEILESIGKLPILKESLTFTKERKKNLDKVEEQLNGLRDEEVRVLHLPAMVTACSHYLGLDPEMHAMAKLDQFVKKENLLDKKSDLRIFGCNNPCPKYPGDLYGYEYYITIPEDQKVLEPLEKRQLPGGLYAVYCIPMGEFARWSDLYDWVNKSTEYELEQREPWGMGGALEEHLNPYGYYKENERKEGFKQLDLMIPIKKR
ncbi:transcriptional activator tipA [Lachnospiraceae bacterium KM106-2]|nr:transcriptional activator tipA [Lachnospiraceae bacterium KM106-2]